MLLKDVHEFRAYRDESWVRYFEFHRKYYSESLTLREYNKFFPFFVFLATWLNSAHEISTETL